MVIPAPSLELHQLSKEEALDGYERMSPEDKRHVDPAWLARVRRSPPHDPWARGFKVVRKCDGTEVGQCGFTGPPDADGVVEIAYGVHEPFRGQGFATEAAGALSSFAMADARVRVIRAHTLPVENASGRVLAKCGFSKVGQAVDHEAGVVWRWEKRVCKKEL